MNAEGAAGTEEAEIVELTGKQMSEISGGSGTIEQEDIERPQQHRFVNSPHCKACKAVVDSIGAWYICKTIKCEEKGVKKAANEVLWY